MTPSRADGRGSRVRLGPLAVLAITIALGLAMDRGWPLEDLERWTLDWRTSLLHRARARDLPGWLVRPSRPTADVVVIEVDDASIDQLRERVPLPRTMFAKLIERLAALGSSLTVMDIFLVGESRDPREDEQLAATLERVNRRERGRAVFTRRSVFEGDSVRTQANPRFFAQHMYSEASALLFRDDDGMVRHYHLANTNGENIYPSIGLFAVIDHWSLKATEFTFTEDRTELVLDHNAEGKPDSGPLTIAIEQPNNGLLLDLAGPRFPFRRVRFTQLDAELKRNPDLVRGKIVLVGLTYSAAHDTHPVPISPSGVRMMDGVHLHAYAMRDLLMGSPMRRAGHAADRVMVSFFLLVCAVLFWRLSPGAATAAFFALTSGWLALSFFAFISRGAVLSTAPPLLAAGMLFVQCLGFRLFEESKNRRSAEVLLSSYFSPAQAAGLESPDDPDLADKLLSAKEVLAPEKYEILGKLGQGGMSVVFRATQHPLGRPVALKFISPRLYRDRDAVARFLREARLSGQLLHPNLVAVFDSGENHGVPYIALELVDGENLKSLVARQGQLTPAEAVGIMVQALAGLDHVHQHGIIHRDIKSENILISRDGMVKITDFGIAKSDRSDAFETMQQVIVGTPAYLSPEQIRAETLTPASDLYSLGIVLYEMLTGRPPFLGESTGAILVKHLQEEPPDLVELGLEIPRGLMAVLRRCLEKQPAERYAKATELSEALTRLNLTARVSGTPAQPGDAPPAPRSGSGTLSMKSIKMGNSTQQIVRPESQGTENP